ncbi:hypothetical protein HN873_050876 [Arachis hypogaea]
MIWGYELCWDMIITGDLHCYDGVAFLEFWGKKSEPLISSREESVPPICVRERLMGMKLMPPISGWRKTLAEECSNRWDRLLEAENFILILGAPIGPTDLGCSGRSIRYAR